MRVLPASVTQRVSVRSSGRHSALVCFTALRSISTAIAAVGTGIAISEGGTAIAA